MIENPLKLFIVGTKWTFNGLLLNTNGFIYITENIVFINSVKTDRNFPFCVLSNKKHKTNNIIKFCFKGQLKQ